MSDPQVERRKMVTIPQEEFEAMLERAAERGARNALHGVGLDGEDAAHDMRELRNLLDAFNEAKKTAGLTIIKMMVTGLVMGQGAGVREAARCPAHGRDRRQCRGGVEHRCT